MRNPERLRQLLEATVARMPAPDGILLSGGLDTAVLCRLYRGLPLHAVTVGLGRRAPDLRFARALARRSGWKHTVIVIGYEELLAALPPTVRVLRTFDPMTLRNNAVIRIALEKARSLGLKRVLTGDGSDEIFAGYRFIFEKSPRAMAYSLRRMREIMHFSANDLGADLGVKILQPYLDPAVVRFSAGLRPAELVASRGGTKFGKAVLRRAFEGSLPEEFVWREKNPIQGGSGSAGLTAHLEKTVSDAEFESGRRLVLGRDGVSLRDKEHYYCYLVFRALFGKVRPGKGSDLICPSCAAAVRPAQGKFCRTCGHWPVEARRKAA